MNRTVNSKLENEVWKNLTGFTIFKVEEADKFILIESYGSPIVQNKIDNKMFKLGYELESSFTLERTEPEYTSVRTYKVISE